MKNPAICRGTEARGFLSGKKFLDKSSRIVLHGLHEVQLIHEC